jgi:predicted acylesterase/phospholipase RssA
MYTLGVSAEEYVHFLWKLFWIIARGSPPDGCIWKDDCDIVYIPINEDTAAAVLQAVHGEGTTHIRPSSLDPRSGRKLKPGKGHKTVSSHRKLMNGLSMTSRLLQTTVSSRALQNSLDLKKLRDDKHAMRLFISATNVRTGKPKVFRREELTVDALLASACLPNVFKAVEIDGEAYWDGGYLGNPALWPLYHERSAADIILVQLNPLYRAEIPTTVSDIMNRLNEISFNASLMSEMRAIDFVQRLLEGGRLEQPRYRRLFLHSIEDEPRMRAFKLSTKFNGDWDFLQTLRQYGHEAADHFLSHSSAQIGRESTLDIQRYL